MTHTRWSIKYLFFALASIASAPALGGMLNVQYGTALTARALTAQACNNGSCASQHDEKTANSGITGSGTLVVRSAFFTPPDGQASQGTFSAGMEFLSGSTIGIPLFGEANVTANLLSGDDGQWLVYVRVQNAEYTQGGLDVLGTDETVYGFPIPPRPIAPLQLRANGNTSKSHERNRKSYGKVIFWMQGADPPAGVPDNWEELKLHGDVARMRNGQRVYPQSTRGNLIAPSDIHLGTQSLYYMKAEERQASLAATASDPNSPEYMFLFDGDPFLTHFTIPEALPISGDSLFEIEFDGMTHSLASGDVFDFTQFTTPGVKEFILRGIDPAEGLTNNDPFPNVVGFQFDSGGFVNVQTGAVLVPEPNSAYIALATLLILAIVLRFPRHFSQRQAAKPQ